MQQQSPQIAMTPPSLASTPSLITTEEVQKYLDENKRLILTIMENQNLGRLAECSQYQARLQKNLMYLAAIADAQPQAPTPPAQTPLQSVVQQDPPHIQQQPQAAMAQQQPSVLTPNSPFQFNPVQSRDQQHHQLLLQQQQLQGPMGMRLGADTSLHQLFQTVPGTSGSLAEALGSKQDLLETGSGGSQVNSAFGRGIGDIDSQF